MKEERRGEVARIRSYENILHMFKKIEKHEQETWQV
jgi:hypothetical protein